VLFAALTLCYIYIVTSPDTLTRKKIPLFCGIVGGFSYLAHHYAFPFFIVHFPSILLLRAYIDGNKKGFPWKNILVACAIGITGFLIIVSIWIGIVSITYGRLTISIKGSIAYSRMGPKDIDRRPPHFYGGLHKPKDEYSIHVFEDPSELKFKTWSPFESKEYFLHQLRVINENLVYIFNHFIRQSPFFTYPFIMGTLSIMIISFILIPLNNAKKFLYLWVTTTFFIYSSGFILIIARSPRRFYALMIVFLLLSFHFLDELKNAVSDIINDRRKKLLTWCLLIIVVSAFSIKPAVYILKALKDIVTVAQFNPYKEIAEQVNVIGFPGPYAIIRTSQKPHTDYYIAYYLKKQLLGRPLSKDIGGITKELVAVNAKTLLVFDNLEIVEKLKNDKRYFHIVSKKLEKDGRYLHAVNIKQDEISDWDDKINIFTLK
jgi:hypothetical protein